MHTIGRMPVCPGEAVIVFLRGVVLENRDAHDWQDFLWGRGATHFFLTRAVEKHWVGVLTRYSVCLAYIVYILGVNCQN